jgi:triacylglycerol lipase
MRRPLARLALGAVIVLVPLAAALVIVHHRPGAPRADVRPPAAVGDRGPHRPAVGAGGRPAAPPLRCATPRHPYPVVLVPGTFEATSWGVIADSLAAHGYCVEGFEYANAGIGSIPRSAGALRRFVDRVLARTHAGRVSIVGHSEGGIVARYYVRFLGGAGKVEDLVALAPPNHGTTTPLVVPGAVLGCIACLQQTAGSGFLATLNGGDGTPAPVDYTVVQTSYDFVVTPYQSAFLRGPASRITNVLLQEGCPADFADHLSITSDPAAVQWIEDALSRSGPADPGFRPRC